MQAGPLSSDVSCNDQCGASDTGDHGDTRPGAGTRQWSHQTQMDGHQAVCDAMVCVTDQIVALHHIIGCDDVCLLWSIVWLCDVPCLITRKL